MSHSLQKWAIRSFAHFWWATWAIHSRLLINSLNDLSESLTVAHLSWATWAIRSHCSEGMSESFAKKNLFKKIVKHEQKIRFFSIFLSESPFFVSEGANERFTKKRAIFSFANLSWVTWANQSHSLICPEGPEQFAHGRSFVLSDLSQLLTFADLSSAIWANARTANAQPCAWGKIKPTVLTPFYQ